MMQNSLEKGMYVTYIRVDGCVVDYNAYRSGKVIVKKITEVEERDGTTYIKVEGNNTWIDSGSVRRAKNRDYINTLPDEMLAYIVGGQVLLSLKGDRDLTEWLGDFYIGGVELEV